jgi:hypothetical protein
MEQQQDSNIRAIVWFGISAIAAFLVSTNQSTRGIISTLNDSSTWMFLCLGSVFVFPVISILGTLLNNKKLLGGRDVAPVLIGIFAGIILGTFANKLNQLNPEFTNVADQVCAGNGFANTTHYDPNLQGFHPILVRSLDDRTQYPNGWLPNSVDKIELVACSDWESSKTVLQDTCRYTGGKIVSRYREDRVYILREAQSGQVITTLTLQGFPAECSDSTLKSDTIHGYVTNEQLFDALSAFVYRPSAPGIVSNATSSTPDVSNPVTPKTPFTSTIIVPYCDENILALADKSTYLCLSSEPNDPLGGGKSQVITPEQGDFSITGWEPDINVSIDLSKGGWVMGFAPPEKQSWNLGLYENAKAFAGSRPLPKILIFMSGTEGESCFGVNYGDNSLIQGSGSGNFELLEYSRKENIVDHLAINFEFHCNNVDAKLKGYLRFHSTLGQ